ncbi:LamB/YcsF family protein [Fructobacillus tropaeoli]|uniref:5-oxoprolinase subunit A n=1 Tax=Fructobacillus tropaeoli TaxID=709323 RepID=A0ABM9ML64_9LACO|nr:5-oxoprolinase subunit PxpA [Fructobacillus tropaeoli]GIC69829.1 5-oxoprolinase subunit PxpA [Fructobacillus tropaeoli]CAK1223876.1 5-oxoprolinase subunit A (PxpA) [Fructobacillus tropaeoli]
MQIDLNSDLGESFGKYKIGLDEEVLKQVTSANIACGFHAGDPTVMKNTVALALQNQTAIGAHPGFHDLQGFGRRKIEMAPAEIEALVQYQVGALAAFVPGHRLHHVKAHGALYNLAAKDRQVADAVVAGIKAADEQTVVYGLANSELIKSAKAAGMKFAQEAFADRNYEADGSLVSRSKENAIITDPAIAAKRVVKMIQDQAITAVNGDVLPTAIDSICVHGDNQAAISLVKRIREALTKEGISITSQL